MNDIKLTDPNCPDVYLRPVDEEDIGERYLAWLNDAGVTRYLETRHQAQTLDTIRDFITRIIGCNNEFLFAICLTCNDRHIGNIKIGPTKPNHSLADVSLFIGEKDCWGKGFATDAIRLVSEHAFVTLNIRKLNAVAYAINTGSIQAFIRAGYSQEGLRRKHYLLDGKLADLVELGLCENELKLGGTA
jgi:[ribosomal protein S5]-alanine N-acetyltransferase